MKNKLIGTIAIVLFLSMVVLVIKDLTNKKSEVLDITTNKFVVSNEISTSVVEPTTQTTTTYTLATTKKTTKKTYNNGTYKLTHYGPNCKGCSGITASGYNVKNTIWYEDSEYGKVRVIATSNQFKMYSIIKIKDYKLGGDLTCIVLDRGVGSGVIDLLVSSEKVANQLGIQRVNIEVLRSGK